MLYKRWLFYTVPLLTLLASVLATAEFDGEVPQELTGLPGQYFAYAVAVSGNYALVGQPRGEVNGMPLGRVLVYEYQGGRWLNVARWTPSSGLPQGARFGAAVAIDGPLAVVGAEGENRGRGAVYFFERRNGVWTQVRKVGPTQVAPNTYFGRAVALAQDYAMVGAPGAGEDALQMGSVQVFQRRGGVWSATALQRLRASDAREFYGFGARLAMRGSTALVGAPEHDAAGAHQDNIGAAYVFELEQGVWREVAKLRASDGRMGDVFGSAVALTAQEAVVGAPGHAGQGAAYVFTRQANGWSSTEAQKLTASDGEDDDRFGASVALAETQLLSGAYGYDAQGQERAGAVYVFARQGPRWTEVEQVTAPQPIPQAHFGYALALSEPHTLIGAPGLLGNPPGRAYTYNDVQSNAAPVLTSVPLTTGQVGNLYAYDVEATDADGDPLTYTLSRAPAGMLIEAATGKITWTPTAAGNADVQVEVRDNHGGKATQSYSLVVSAPNRPPVFTSPPLTIARVGVPYVYQLVASDPEADVLQYRLVLGPPGMAIQPTGLLTWTPVMPGSVSVQLLVEDGRGGSAMQTYTLAVTATNQPPRLTSTPSTHAEMAQVVPLVRVSDAHLARQTITLNGQPYVPGTPISADGDYVLSVEATDMAGNTTVKTVRFTLQRPPSQ